MRLTTASFRPVRTILIALAALVVLGAWSSRPLATDGLDAYPLDPPDTSSPRATLRSFLANMTAAHLAFSSGAGGEAVARPFRRAMQCLDLSQVAESLRGDVGGYSALLLKEILDRIQLPNIEAVPAIEGPGAEPLTAWSIPRTEITIARVSAGNRPDVYLFSPQTVARLPEFYDRSRHLPYKPGATQGLLELYLDSPGGQVPLKFAQSFPSWTKLRIFDRPLWKWAALLAYVAAGVAAIALSLRPARIRKQQDAAAQGRWHLSSLVLALAFVLWSWGLDVFVDDVIGLRGPAEAIIKRGALVLSFCAAILVVFAVLEVVGGFVITANRVPPTSGRAHFIRIVLRLIGIVIASYVVVDASAYLGWAVAPLLAGLGVGGLAVALAARPTIENVIAGLILFLDKPVLVGEFCRFGDKLGTLEEVGLRSTRIRSLDRAVISIPNSEFSQMHIENLSRRDAMLFRTMVGLRYETTPDQLRFVLARLREMLVGHPRVSPDPARARFWGYGDSSLNVEIFAYVRTRDWNEYMAIREDLNLRIMDVVRESGTSIAFPSQTVYLRRDGEFDARRREESEAHIAELRARGELPFPEFDPALRARIEDTLDYPPRGSPGSVPANAAG